MRMVHNLGNTQVLCDRADGVYSLVQCAPRYAVQYACLDVCAFVKSEGAGIFRCTGRDTAGGIGLTGDQLG
ncbi:MAG: hypothetical protein ACYSWZ_08900 [Planctomycetota bacterium]